MSENTQNSPVFVFFGVPLRNLGHSDFRGLFRISEGCFGVLEINKSKLNPFPIVFPKTTHISRTKDSKTAVYVCHMSSLAP